MMLSAALSMHALHAGNGAGRDHSGFLLFTSDAHHDQVAVPGRFGGHADVSRPAIGEMDLEQDHLVRGAIRDGAAHASHASCCARSARACSNGPCPSETGPLATARGSI